MVFCSLFPFISGARRDHSASFLGIRKKTVERVHLESNRLEKRLEKLARVYADATAQFTPVVNPNAPVLLLPQSANPKRSDSTSTMSSVMSTRPRPNPAATPSLLALKKIRGGFLVISTKEGGSLLKYNVECNRLNWVANSRHSSFIPPTSICCIKSALIVKFRWREGGSQVG